MELCFWLCVFSAVIASASFGLTTEEVDAEWATWKKEHGTFCTSILPLSISSILLLNGRAQGETLSDKRPFSRSVPLQIFRGRHAVEILSLLANRAKRGKCAGNPDLRMRPHNTVRCVEEAFSERWRELIIKKSLSTSDQVYTGTTL